MKTRILTCLLAVFLVFTAIPGAMATETETTAAIGETKPIRGEFECGDELTWAYDDGVLTITGQGEMDDYETEAPWAKYKDDIEAVIFIGDVTYIGERAFKDFDELESVDFGDKLKEIGKEAFRSCDDLESIALPATFKTFGESSFASCKELKEIHSKGKFPTFRLNCFWDTYATIYYPAERPWSVSLIQELEEAFHGRIEFRASDGSDPYVPTETTVPEMEVTTEAPTEMPTETTVPVTEVPTEVPTETTVPETGVAPETEASEMVTEAPEMEVTEEIPNAEERSVKLLIIGFGAAVVLTLAVALVMVLRQLKKKGKYSA